MSQLYLNHIWRYPLYRNRTARKGKIVVVKFYFKLRFIWTFISIAFYPDFLKLGTQFVIYYTLRCNSTQFVIHYKLRNYYKLQRNSASNPNMYRSLFQRIITLYLFKKCIHIEKQRLYIQYTWQRCTDLFIFKYKLNLISLYICKVWLCS